MTGDATGSAPASAAQPRSAEGRPSLLSDMAVPLVLAAFATYLLVGLLSMTVPDSVDFPGPRFFPAVIVALIYLLVTAQAFSTWRTRARNSHAATPGSGSAVSGSTATTAVDDAAPQFSWHSFAWVVGGFLGFALTLEFLGWIIGAAMLFWCVARGFGSGRPWFSLVVGLTVSSLAYIAFDMALGLSLPSGVLGGGF
ncbi:MULTISPECIES: tripartite tricarboxylate transporter TctB family protein [Kocuria]|uniref:tripartite tricarboxylate transporter TctB family protein n=1 Tax=Kocuria TaxID=57493 RepID=UPI0021A70D50|nr:MULTISPECIES: tripartite tricarboxylate transporter TctB family protein [Kocuria]MCT1545146.1 tripartite tricarboxylate transporter TctB family protein [Kocuria rhizophila]MCT2170487.1 tripartite tricarboxylate transporter TctB family protein [Kocuria rhizophila]MDN3463478.1 tripartite tricarboxylate transporter TctB family protein [Kocuria sp. APC 4018]